MLRELLQTPEYTNKSVEEIFNLLNTPVMKLQPLAVPELRKWMLGIDGLKKLALVGVEHPAYSIAQTLLILYKEPDRSLDLNDEKVQQAISGLVLSGVITPQESEDLYNTATVPSLPLGHPVTKQSIIDTLYGLGAL